jgi:creatinine amidohydrolase
LEVKRGKRIWWQQFKRPELVEYAKKVSDIAMLPLGSIEQHGEHLPTGEDSFHAIGIAERVAERTDVMLLPCPWYGCHPYQHYYYAGTIPLSFDTYKNMLKDIVRGASWAGFNKFIFLNCHGQEWAISPAVQELGLEGYFVVSATLWHITKEAIGKIMETGFFHAEESETSLGLYLVPELVDMSKAHDEVSEKLIDEKWFAGPGKMLTRHVHWHDATFAMPEYKHLKHGVIGYPTKATAEKGKALVEEAVKWLVEFIEYIKKKYPIGVKPEVK